MGKSIKTLWGNVKRRKSLIEERLLIEETGGDIFVELDRISRFSVYGEVEIRQLQWIMMLHKCGKMMILQVSV